LEAASVFATSPDMFQGSADAAAFARIAGAAKLVRFGADCYAYGLVALGLIDVVIEASLKVYDFSAMAPIVAGAGGVASDWQGRPLTTASDGRVLVAGDPRAHEAALALLAA
jgi:fructose-1,6-bisphosphatase/inositol monophosphatase family enzyme